MAKSGSNPRFLLAPVDARLARSLWQVLTLGVLVPCLLPPTLRTQWLAAGGAWLLFAPACSLLVCYRRGLVAWARANATTPRRALRVQRSGSSQARRALNRATNPAARRLAA